MATNKSNNTSDVVQSDTNFPMWNYDGGFTQNSLQQGANLPPFPPKKLNFFRRGHIWEATYFSLNRVQVTDNWWTNFDPKKLEVKVLWKKTSKDATWRTASQNNIATTEKLSIFGSEKKIYWKLGRDLHTLAQQVVIQSGRRLLRRKIRLHYTD